MRILVASLDAAGNWPPELALIKLLTDRGHDVRVLTYSAHADQVREAGATYVPYLPGTEGDERFRATNKAPVEVQAVLRHVYLNTGVLDSVLQACRSSKPDVLLVDQLLMSAHAAAQSLKIPVVTLWHSIYGALIGHRSIKAFPAAFIAELNAMRSALELAPDSDGFSCVRDSDAMLVFSYDFFDAVPQALPAHVTYVGPLACSDNASAMSARESDEPTVLVSYSTSFQNQGRILQRIADAIADMPLSATFTLGSSISPDELKLPSNARAASYIPHATLWPATSLAITHGGHGTVMSALTAGVPVLCTPMGRDQHAVADCVADRGVGTFVPEDSSVERLRMAIESCLNNESMRRAAKRFSERASGSLRRGRRRSVEIVERLATRA